MCYRIVIVDICFIEILMLINLFLLSIIKTLNNSWYLIGIYLFLLGFILLLEHIDILVGFLWIIDLGLGLIFFIFILFILNFLHFKVKFFYNLKQLGLINFIILFVIIILYHLTLSYSPLFLNFNTWFFNISFYDYFIFFNLSYKSDLVILKELFYTKCIFEFFLINLLLLYTVLLILILNFFYKYISISITYVYFIINKFLIINSFNFFFKNQNYWKQLGMTCGVRVWNKKKTKEFLKKKVC